MGVIFLKIPEHILKLQVRRSLQDSTELRAKYGLKKIYKLGSNENPLGPSPQAMEAMKSFLNQVHRYPDSSAHQVRQALSDYYGVDPHKMTFGNGSRELIRLLIRLFCETEDSVVTTKPIFTLYEISCRMVRVKCHTVCMGLDFRFDVKALCKKF